MLLLLQAEFTNSTTATAAAIRFLTLSKAHDHHIGGNGAIPLSSTVVLLNVSFVFSASILPAVFSLSPLQHHTTEDHLNQEVIRTSERNSFDQHCLTYRSHRYKVRSTCFRLLFSPLHTICAPASSLVTSSSSHIEAILQSTVTGCLNATSVFRSSYNCRHQVISNCKIHPYLTKPSLSSYSHRKSQYPHVCSRRHSSLQGCLKLCMTSAHWFPRRTQLHGYS